LEGGERRRERQESLGGIVSFFPLSLSARGGRAFVVFFLLLFLLLSILEIRGGEEGKKGEGVLRETNLREKCGENRGKE